MENIKIEFDKSILRSLFKMVRHPIQIGIKLDFFVFGINQTEEGGIEFTMKEKPILTKMIPYEQFKRDEKIDIDGP
jgi:hypothetical protein